MTIFAFAFALGGISLLSLVPGIMIQAYATAIVYSGPLEHTYNLIVENQSYPIRYGMLGNGTVESMWANSTSKSITVIINDNSTSDEQGGLLAIELPRKMIDANTTEFAGGCSSGSASQYSDLKNMTYDTTSL